MNDTCDEKINKDDLFAMLDRLIDGIHSCDNRVSISLGVFGVILAIIFNSSGIDNLRLIITVSITHNIIYLVFLGLTGVVFIYGLITLALILVAKLDNESYKQKGIDLNPIAYYGSTAKFINYLKYKERVLSICEEDLYNNILSEVYIVCLISNKKHKDFNKGYIISLIGFISFCIVWGIGVLIFI